MWDTPQTVATDGGFPRSAPRPADRAPERLFLEELGTIERAIHFACRRAGLRDFDAEDFESFVKLKLIENDYAVLRKFEGRCTFSAFISVVVQRMLLDDRIRMWGKWHASTEAKRMGETGVALESMIVRDGRSLDEAVVALKRLEPGLTRADVKKMADRLPRRRRRPRAVDLDSAFAELHAVAATPPEAVSEADRAALSCHIGRIVRSTIDTFPEDDRLILRLRFERGMNVAEIARALNLEQKPLYRRIQRGLRALREGLQAAGVSAADADEMLRSPGLDLDFGFDRETRTVVGEGGVASEKEAS